MIEGILVPSSNRGHYALDDPEEGHDLTSGQQIDIWLGGKWISGSVDPARSLYVVERADSLHTDEYRENAEGGYYFAASDGGSCGLCVGMRVRLP